MWSAYLSAVGPVLRALPLLRLRADSRYTVADYIEAQVAKHADLPFILFEDRRITYGEYNAMANRVAHWGLSVGFEAGDTIGFMMTNRAEYVPVWSGLAKIGVKAALINTNLVGSSVIHALEVAGADRLLLGAECVPNVADMADDALSNLTVYVLPEEGAGAPALAGGEDIREAPFDARAFHQLAVSTLPAYAVPVFVRLQSESDVTGTFKLRKAALRCEGYDPTAADEPIYVRNDAGKTYVRLQDPADARVR